MTKAIFIRILPALAAALCFAACEIDSSNTSSVAADASGTVYDFTGLYTPTDNAEYLVYPITRQSGKKLTWMRITQDGTALQAFDNAGSRWSGAIHSISGANARFTLDGSTSAGGAVTISGLMSYADNSSTISASWLEKGYSPANFFAKATVSPPSTNTTSGLTISPSSATLAMGNSRSFSASGGDGSYSWSLSGSCASLSSTSGSSVTATWSSTGSATLTVTSGEKSASASITCN